MDFSCSFIKFTKLIYTSLTKRLGCDDDNDNKDGYCFHYYFLITFFTIIDYIF